MSGLQQRQISIAQLYNAFTITRIMQIEEMGFAEHVGGGEFFLSDAGGPNRASRLQRVRGYGITLTECSVSKEKQVAIGCRSPIHESHDTSR